MVVAEFIWLLTSARSLEASDKADPSAVSACCTPDSLKNHHCGAGQAYGEGYRINRKQEWMGGLTEMIVS